MRVQILAGTLVLAISAAAQAGSVSASISGGHLYLYGDSGGSNLTVDSPAEGRIRVTGSVTAEGQDTVVNNQPNGTVILEGWTRGIFNYSYAGNDTLTFQGLTIRGPAHVDLGDGDDGFIIGDVLPAEEAAAAAATTSVMTTAKSLLVIGARGADMVVINGLFVEGAATLDLGEGADVAMVGTTMQNSNDVSVVIGQSCVIIPGNQADIVDITATDVYANLTVDDAQDELTLNISDVNVDDSVFLYGTPANDHITTQNLNVTRLLKVISEGGDDTLQINGSSATTEVFPGLGNDAVELLDLSTTRAHVYLDPGNDELSIQAGSYSYLYGYGAGGNDLFRLQNASVGQAFLYGDGGTDSYEDGGGNRIGNLKLYSIENK